MGQKADRLFAPSLGQMCLSFLLAFLFTACLYGLTNGVIELEARWSIGATGSGACVIKPNPPVFGPTDVQNGPYTAWGAFDRVRTVYREKYKAEIPAWQRLVCGLEALRTDNSEVSFIKDKNIPVECKVDRGTTVDLDRLMDVVLGVKSRNSVKTPGIVRAYEPGGSLNGIAYKIDNPRLRKPECKAMREAVDAFEAVVMMEMKKVQDEVSWSRWILKAINGLVQFLMFVFAFWAGAVGCVRIGERRLMRQSGALQTRLQRMLNASALERDMALAEMRSRLIYELESSSRVIERWILDSIPLIGFVGTVYGMVNAMDLVVNVVTASPGVNLATAMKEITGALGVAFSATLLGLVSTILLSWFYASIYAREALDIEAVVSESSSTLRPRNVEL